MEARDLTIPVERKLRETETSLSAVLERPGQWRIQRGSAPEPGSGQVRVRLEGCGVCASGIPVWEGRPWFEYPCNPGELGHEGWGTIDAFGAGTEKCGFELGDRVAFLAQGSYATHLCLPVQDVLSLPESLRGKAFPAEPVGCAVNVLERSEIRPGSTTLIIGMGFLGCVLLQLIQYAGGRVIGISSRPTSRKVADDLGALHTFPFEEPWKARESLGSLGYERFSRVIEATGTEAGLALASELVGERGRLIIAGYHQDGLRQVNMQQWNWKGIDVINAHERAPARYTSGMKRGIELADAGAIDLEPMLTHRYPLDGINKAYRDLVDRPEGFMKACIDLS